MADRSDLRVELRNETKDNLFGPMCSGRVIALLATWALVGGKWFEHTIASPTTLRQSSRRFFRNGCSRLRSGTAGLRS